MTRVIAERYLKLKSELMLQEVEWMKKNCDNISITLNEVQDQAQQEHHTIIEESNNHSMLKIITNCISSAWFEMYYFLKELKSIVIFIKLSTKLKNLFLKDKTVINIYAKILLKIY